MLAKNHPCKKRRKCAEFIWPWSQFAVFMHLQLFCTLSDMLKLARCSIILKELLNCIKPHLRWVVRKKVDIDKIPLNTRYLVQYWISDLYIISFVGVMPHLQALQEISFVVETKICANLPDLR